MRGNGRHSSQLRNPDEDIPEQSMLPRAGGFESLSRKFRNEFGFAEAVVGRMIQELSINPTFQGGPGNFFKKEGSARLENPPNLGDALLPVKHVVERAEIEYRVEAPSFKGQFFRIPLHQRHACRVVLALKPCTRSFDLQGIQVDPINMCRVELPEDHLNPTSPSAAYFQHSAARHRATQLA